MNTEDEDAIRRVNNMPWVRVVPVWALALMLAGTATLFTVIVLLFYMAASPVTPPACINFTPM